MKRSINLINPNKAAVWVLKCNHKGLTRCLMALTLCFERFFGGEMSTQPHRRNIGWYAASTIVVIVIIVVAVVLAYQYSQPNIGGQTTPTPPPVSPTGQTVTISIYSGEITPNSYGFGSSPSNITSPGPTFTVKTGTTVTIDFSNAGAMVHNVAVVTEKTDGSGNLAFTNSAVGSGMNPLPPAGRGSTTFVASQPGEYFYICQVDGHVSLGMWGYFIVTE